MNLHAESKLSASDRRVLIITLTVGKVYEKTLKGIIIRPQKHQWKTFRSHFVIPQKVLPVKSVQIWSFFLSVFSCIETEYGEIRSIFLYLVRMRDNTDQKKLRIWTLFTQW